MTDRPVTGLLPTLPPLTMTGAEQREYMDYVRKHIDARVSAGDRIYRGSFWKPPHRWVAGQRTPPHPTTFEEGDPNTGRSCYLCGHKVPRGCRYIHARWHEQGTP